MEPKESLRISWVCVVLLPRMVVGIQAVRKEVHLFYLLAVNRYPIGPSVGVAGLSYHHRQDSARSCLDHPLFLGWGVKRYHTCVSSFVGWGLIRCLLPLSLQSWSSWQVHLSCITQSSLLLIPPDASEVYDCAQQVEQEEMCHHHPVHSSGPNVSFNFWLWSHSFCVCELQKSFILCWLADNIFSEYWNLIYIFVFFSAH